MKHEIDVKRKVQELGPWYHNFNLGGVLTNPANPEYPESRWRLIEPHIPEDLQGKTVLDLGCNAGYFSLQMKKRGATVTGIDVTPSFINQAEFIAEFFGLDIDYRVTNVYQYLLQNKNMFDYVLFLGLFYHLRYPLFVLDKLSEITNEKMYFQTVIRGTPPLTDDAKNLPL
jgi:tRNA (mo5U34)-methyltransferase